MEHEVTSKHLGGTSELMLVMPLKKGLVESRRTMTYATRTRLLLATLNEIRKKSIEERLVRAYAGPVESLRVIDTVRWSILDNDTKLLMAVSFKGPWEPYIRQIARDAGPVLDSILCSCEGYEDHSSEQGYSEFSKWARKHQTQCEFLFSSTPYLSIDDLQYLQELEHLQRSEPDLEKFDLEAALFRANTPETSAHEVRKENPVSGLRQGLQILEAMHRLKPYFADRNGRKDELFLWRLTHKILADFPNNLPKQLLSKKVKEIYKSELRWLNTNIEVEKENMPVADTAPPTTLIQSNILSPNKDKHQNDMTSGCLLLMRLNKGKKAQRFLKDLQRKVTKESETEGGVDVAINVAFTFEGLKTLGLSTDQLLKLPKEFREGMAARAGFLGDVRTNHPEYWNPPKRNFAGASDKYNQGQGQPVALSTVDLVIHLLTNKPADPGDYAWSETHPLYSEIMSLADNEGAQILSVEPIRRVGRNGHAVGHFDFVDGISQPAYKGSPNETFKRDEVPLGELLLGYENKRGDSPADYDGDDLLRNGTFLVIRKLKQNLKEFEAFLNDSSKQLGKMIGVEQPEAKKLLKAKMMGRYADGEPLALPKDMTTPPAKQNDFDFSGDEKGALCPFHTHIRRCNPRTDGKDGEPPAPRIVRRGMSYGPEYSADSAVADMERGLMFMAYNSSIADQFEVLQRWISSGNRTGSLSAQSDPLLGVPERNKSRMLRFIHVDDKGDQKVIRFDMNKHKKGEKDKQFVKLEWGAYLFVPSVPALGRLADYAADTDIVDQPSQQYLEKARKVVQQLRELEKHQKVVPPQDPNDAVDMHWKKLLEDLSSKKSGLTKAVWAVIRDEYGGVLQTPYAVLVGAHEKVMKVFREDATYSVCEYRDRMDSSLGLNILGIDREAPRTKPDRYEREAGIPKELIGRVKEEEAFNLARGIAKNHVDKMVNGASVLRLVPLCESILAELSAEWFGIPDNRYIYGGSKTDDKDRLVCPDDFVAVARYIFSPNPTDFIQREGKQQGQKLLDAAKQHIDEVRNRRRKLKNEGVISKKLFAKISNKDRLARTLVGLVKAFVAPTFGISMSVLNNLIEERRLWRLQQIWQEAGNECKKSKNRWPDAERLLMPELIQSMRSAPVPGLLHRTAVKKAKIGNVSLEPGDRIVLGVASATKDKEVGSPTEVMFGGDYSTEVGKGTPTHACPGQKMAIGVMLGVISAILEAGELKSEAPLVLSVK